MNSRIIFIGWGLVLGALLLIACGDDKGTSTGASRETPQPSPKAVPQTVLADPENEEPPPPPPTGRPVVAYRDGKAEAMTEPQAIAAGLAVIDLSNYWVPFIFSERDSEDQERIKNDFRPIFRKLANDWHYESNTMAAAREIVEKRVARARSSKIWALKQEGKTLDEIREILGIKEVSDGGVEEVKEDDNSYEGGLGEAKNFLEVFGIPPSLSVLRRRAVNEINRDCYNDVDFEAIRRFDGFVAYKSKAVAQKESKRGRTLSRNMRREMEKFGIDDPLELSKQKNVKISEKGIKLAILWEALAETQKLLVCEGLFQKGQEKSYWKGGLDWKTHQALLYFERKNRIFGWGFFGKDTLATLGRTPQERLYDGFMRVLSERIIDGTKIIEDGSAKDAKGKAFTYKDAEGKERSVRNLVAEFTAAALRHMDLGTPDKVIKFLTETDDEKLNSLFIAIPMPELPPYYSDIMAISATIDRGDVYYDYPYNEEGKPRFFSRSRMPTTTLSVKWNEQDIPIFRTNTTIGGWRSELAPDGYEYYRYKNSDVGPRVWKDIIAGPVWLPPSSTPTGDLVKEVTYRGRKVKVPNYDEFGPWYASAYGLVAGFHVRPVERKSGKVSYFDNGIRSHGSVDYNSILRRHSHGCHRLYNHLAIRIFDFVLRHSEYERVGQIPVGYSKKIVLSEEEGQEEESYVINIKSKGYGYELKRPVPVEVLKGRIRGRIKNPIEGYIPKPGVEYGPDAQFLPDGYVRESEKDAGVPEAKEPSTATADTAAKPADTAAKPAVTTPKPQ